MTMAAFSHRERRGWTWAAGLSAVLFFSFPAWAFSPSAVPASTKAPGVDLQSFLDRAADYCDKLSRSALHFICREQIEEWFYPDYGRTTNWDESLTFVGIRKTFRYLYDYQLLRAPDGAIRESRTLLKDEGRDVRQPDAPLKTHFFTYAYVVMGPIGLLSRSHQADHDYRILREEKIGGKPAVVIEAVPKPGVRLDHLIGTVWLRKSDAGILKIEWNPSSIQNYQGVEEMARSLQLTPSLLMTSEYAFEKNGIRFPSRYTIQEIYSRPFRQRFLRSQTEVVYDRYQFFTVETEVKF